MFRAVARSQLPCTAFSSFGMIYTFIMMVSNTLTRFLCTLSPLGDIGLQSVNPFSSPTIPKPLS